MMNDRFVWPLASVSDASHFVSSYDIGAQHDAVAPSWAMQCELRAACYERPLLQGVRFQRPFTRASTARLATTSLSANIIDFPYESEAVAKENRHLFDCRGSTVVAICFEQMLCASHDGDVATIENNTTQRNFIAAFLHKSLPMAAVMGADHRLYTLDETTMSVRQCSDKIFSALFSPPSLAWCSNASLLAISAAKMIRIFDFRSARVVQSFQLGGSADSIRQITASNSNSVPMIAALSDDASVSIFDCRSTRQEAIKHDIGSIVAIDWHPTIYNTLTMANDAASCLENLHCGSGQVEPLPEFSRADGSTQQRQVFDFNWLNDGREMFVLCQSHRASGATDFYVEHFQLRQQQLTSTMQQTACFLPEMNVLSACFNADDERVYFSAGDERIYKVCLQRTPKVARPACKQATTTRLSNMFVR